jgi:hypothetical protein
MNGPGVGRCLLSTVVPACWSAWNLGVPVRGGVFGTLLGFEESEPWPSLWGGLLVLGLRCLFGPVVHLWVGLGCGGRVVCELDSGREHLWQLFTRSCHFLTPPGPPLLVGG